MQVTDRTVGDFDRVARFLTERHARPVARRGELLDPMQHPALLAVAGGDLAGVLTYIPSTASCEVLTLHVADQWRGIGTALLDALVRSAGPRWTQLRVTTTNDNLNALRFYQRRGFALAELRAGAVDAARSALKPAIPLRGCHGLPIRDELELTRPL